MPKETLTAARVEQLKRTPPKTGRVEIWDAKTPGLCLRISTNGSATWSLRYRPRNGGGKQRITLWDRPTLSGWRAPVTASAVCVSTSPTAVTRNATA